MKRCIMFILVTLFVLSTGTAALAAHFTTGGEGYKGPSLPSDGTYWKIYNVYYTANELKDDSGHNSKGGEL